MLKFIYFPLGDIGSYISFPVPKDKDIEALLDRIKGNHGIPYTVIQAKSIQEQLGLTENLFYEKYIAKNSLIMENFSFLIQHGIKIDDEPLRKKFKTNSGYTYLSGTLHLFDDDVLILSLKTITDDVIGFLNLVNQNPSILNDLKTSKKTSNKFKTSEASNARTYRGNEKSVIVDFIKYIKQKHPNVKILREVKQSSMTDKFYAFASPDLDLVVIDGEIVTCYEAKASSDRSFLYAALGEAMFDLINPVIFDHLPSRIISPETGFPSTPIIESKPSGGICDKVYVLLPDEPKDVRALPIFETTPIGIILSDGTELLPAKPNPFIDHQVKSNFLSHLYLFKML